MSRRPKSHLILPIFVPPSRESVRDERRARYGLALIRTLEGRYQATGEIDYSLCDRIESVLWPRGSVPPMNPSTERSS